MRNFLILAAVVFMVVLVGGCAKQVQPVSPTGTMNTTEHHLQVGWQLLEARDGQGALQAFDNALVITPESSVALSGRSRALTMLGRQKEAFQAAELALYSASGMGEVAKAKLSAMHALTVFRPDDWLDRTRDSYSAAVKAGGETPEAMLLMANALATARQYDEAATLYSKAVTLGGPEAQSAGAAWKTMQETRLLESSQRAARDMARKEIVTRAEFSAILVEGLYLHQIIAALKDSAPVSEFMTPSQLNAGGESASLAIPVDVEGHPLASDITAVLALRLRGLEPLPGGGFRPDAPMTRAETAMALQDLSAVLDLWGADSTVTGSGAMPFSDVPAGHYSTGAIEFSVAHSLMTPRASGRFEPARPLSGLEAVSGVQEIRSAMNLPRENVLAGEAPQGMSEKWKLRLFMAMLKSGLLFLI